MLTVETVAEVTGVALFGVVGTICATVLVAVGFQDKLMLDLKLGGILNRSRISEFMF